MKELTRGADSITGSHHLVRVASSEVVQEALHKFEYGQLRRILRQRHNTRQKQPPVEACYSCRTHRLAKTVQSTRVFWCSQRIRMQPALDRVDWHDW